MLLYSSTLQYPEFASKFQGIFLIFFYQFHFYLLILPLHLYPLLHHHFPFGVRASNPQRRPHWQCGKPSLPTRAGTTLHYTCFTCTYCITNIQTSGSSTRREDVTIAKLLPSVQLTILAPWPIPNCSHSIGAVFCVFININCMHPLVLD